MVFTYAYNSPKITINDAVCIAETAFRSNRFWLISWAYTINLPIIEIREIDYAVRNSECASTVFMHSSACIKITRN